MINTSGPCGAKDGPAYEFDGGAWSIGPDGPRGRGPEDEEGDS